LAFAASWYTGAKAATSRRTPNLAVPGLSRNFSATLLQIGHFLQ
jgi:hypothetical protein